MGSRSRWKELALKYVILFDLQCVPETGIITHVLQRRIQRHTKVMLYNLPEIIAFVVGVGWLTREQN